MIMNRRTFAAAALALAVVVPTGAQPQPSASIEYTPVGCIRGGELALLQAKVKGQGELRAYFRRLNTTDWCSVEGQNDGPLSKVVMPKFDIGDEIEYFLVLIDGRRVVARSPRIYRTRVTADCQAPYARHMIRISLTCSEEAQGVPMSLATGYALTDELIPGPPLYGSPDRP